MTSETEQQSPKSTLAESNESDNGTRYSLLVSVTVQFLCSLLHAVFAGISTQYCAETKFASVSILGAALLTILTFSICFTSYMKLKIGICLVIEIISCVISLILLIYESLTLKCTTPTDEIFDFCRRFRKTANLCGAINGTEMAIPQDTFRTGRVLIVAVSLLNLCCSGLAFAVFMISIKAGNPVYLSRKRHRTSIVVGDSSNGMTAFENRAKNVEIVIPNDTENQQYDKKRNENKNKKKLKKQSTLLRQSLTTQNKSVESSKQSSNPSKGEKSEKEVS